ncbi:MAG TPA: L-fucose/L-arabinose isomerase family protein [Chloroflexota bacterium]|nr:L-fucose/L-arabinose isomerase family protein [Chloroflexota bacterium]
MADTNLKGTAEGRPRARIGVFGIGLAAYWPQFPGLRERLEGYQHTIEERLVSLGAEVVSAGLVDTAPAAQQAGDRFARERVDLLVCYVGTYATSSQVLPAVQAARVPVLVLNLQPSAALDYPHTDTGEWLANCSACCVPELSAAFARTGIGFNVVSGVLDPHDPHTDAGRLAWEEIGAWVRAAGAVQALARSRIGFLGHTYPGMLDLYADLTRLQGKLGIHVELLEMEDLQERVAAAGEGDVAAKQTQLEQAFELDTSVDAESLTWAARVACGLDRLVADFDLQGLTYYYRGLHDNLFERLGAALIAGNSLLTARGIPCAGEGDIQTCLAMLLMDRLGAGGSFTEFYAMDFREGFVLMGHDGPGHVAISDRRPILRGLELYHGKRGRGVSVEFAVKHGPVTLLGLTHTADGGLKLLAAEGESIPGPILRIGNTNSRLRFSLDPAAFVTRWAEAGPPHHCALGIGHQLPAIRRLARLLGLPLEEVAAASSGA